MTPRRIAKRALELVVACGIGPLRVLVTWGHGSAWGRVGVLLALTFALGLAVSMLSSTTLAIAIGLLGLFGPLAFFRLEPLVILRMLAIPFALLSWGAVLSPTTGTAPHRVDAAIDPTTIHAWTVRQDVSDGRGRRSTRITDLAVGVLIDAGGTRAAIVCETLATAGCATKFKTWDSDDGWVRDVDAASRAGWLQRISDHDRALAALPSTLPVVEAAEDPTARASRIRVIAAIAMLGAAVTCAWPSRAERRA